MNHCLDTKNIRNPDFPIYLLLLALVEVCALLSAPVLSSNQCPLVEYFTCFGKLPISCSNSLLGLVNGEAHIGCDEF